MGLKNHKVNLPMQWVRELTDDETKGFLASMRETIKKNLHDTGTAQELKKRADLLWQHNQKIKALNQQNKHWKNLANTLKSGATDMANKGKLNTEINTFTQEMAAIYQLVQEMLGILRGEKITYAIYLEIEGKTHRLALDEIPIDNFKIGSSGDLMFNFSKADYLQQYEKQAGQHLQLIKHYSDYFDFLQITYYYKEVGLPNSYYNKGVIAEAFEEHIQPEEEHNTGHTWDRQKIWQQINDAADDATAWYVQGDVKNIQVKNITSGALRVASLTSLEIFSDILLQFRDYPNEQTQELILEQLMQNMKIVHKKRELDKRLLRETGGFFEGKLL